MVANGDDGYDCEWEPSRGNSHLANELSSSHDMDTCIASGSWMGSKVMATWRLGSDGSDVEYRLFSIGANSEAWYNGDMMLIGLE